MDALQKENEELRSKIQYLEGKIAVYEGNVERLKDIAEDMYKYTPLLDWFSEAMKSFYGYLPSASRQHSIDP